MINTKVYYYKVKDRALVKKRIMHLVDSYTEVNEKKRLIESWDTDARLFYDDNCFVGVFFVDSDGSICTKKREGFTKKKYVLEETEEKETINYFVPKDPARKKQLCTQREHTEFDMLYDLTGLASGAVINGGPGWFIVSTITSIKDRRFKRISAKKWEKLRTLLGKQKEQLK